MSTHYHVKQSWSKFDEVLTKTILTVFTARCQRRARLWDCIACRLSVCPSVCNV